MIYLASPYSAKETELMQKRFEDVMQCTAALINKGLPIFSPILHCHEMAGKHELPTDAASWQTYNTAFLRKADAVYVLCIPFWRESLGVTQEIALANTLEIPVVYVDVFGDTL